MLKVKELKELEITRDSIIKNALNGVSLAEKNKLEVVAFFTEFVSEIVNDEANKELKLEAFKEFLNSEGKKRITLAVEKAEYVHKMEQAIPDALKIKGYELVHTDEIDKLYANKKNGQILKYDKGDSIEKF